MAEEYCWAITVTTGGGAVLLRPKMFHCVRVWILSVSHLRLVPVLVRSAVTVTALARTEAQRTPTRVAGLAVQRQFRDAPSKKKV